MEDKIIYRNEPFYLQSSGKYYQSGRKQAGERLLHRRIWTDVHGGIDKGYHIHHKDGDWTNNKINNLELILGTEHSRRHMKARMKDPIYRANAEAGRKKAIIKARDWHKAEENRKWHSDIAKLSYKNRVKYHNVCSICSTTFWTYRAFKNTCSNSCWQKQRRTIVR